MRESVLTKNEFKKLKEAIFTYHTAKDTAIIHRTIPSFLDDEKACYYKAIEREMKNKIRKLLQS